VQAELNSTTLNDANDCLNKGKKSAKNDSNLIRHVQLDQTTTRPLPPTRRGDKNCTVQNCNTESNSQQSPSATLMLTLTLPSRTTPKNLFSRELFFFLKTRTDGIR